MRAIAALIFAFAGTTSVAAEAQLSEDRLYRSAYFAGRGDTGISVADDEEAIFYNPAGLASGKGIYKRTVIASPHVEVSKSTRDIMRRIGLERDDAIDTALDQVGKPNHARYQNFTGLLLRRAALGVIASGTVDVLASKSPDHGGLEEIQAATAQNAGLTFTLAEAFFGDALQLGVTGKYLMRGEGYLRAGTSDADAAKTKFDDASDFVALGEGGGIDAGLLWRLAGRTNPRIGLTVNDIGNTNIAPQEDTTLDLDLKQTVNFGISVEPGTATSKLRLLADYRDALGTVQENALLRTHLGAELTVLDAIGITGGLSQGYPTAGFYVDLYFLRIDLGMYTEELSDYAGRRPDTRFVGRLRIGF